MNEEAIERMKDITKLNLLEKQKAEISDLK